MREIKFRGKAWFGGEWHYGLLAKGTGDYTYIKSGHVGVRVDPKTVGQFIGLTTDEDNEIYEDDIVQFYDPCECKRLTALVTWDKDFCSFNCTIDGEPVCGLSVAILNFNDFELLGNIFDHPELLNQ